MGHRSIALCSALLLFTGCAITHERGDDVGVLPLGDAGPLPTDAVVVRPDAFVPSRDAWTPPFAIAPHGPAPIVPDQGGRHMRHPQLVVITYADDPNRATLEAQARWLVGSSWLTTVGAEYGVGAGSILGVVERTVAAPATISGPEIQALLRAGIADHSLPTPAGGDLGEALYVAYFPAHTTITDPLLGTSCETHAGYHNETTTADGRPFSYAVIPSCGSSNPLLSDVEQEEEALTHEVIEAATDSLPFTAPGFAFSTTALVPSPWLVAGAELADLCEYRFGPSAFVREGGFVAARVWSNAAAALNDRDPCAPADLAVAYGSLSITPDEIVGVPAGSSTTFDVTAWTTARMPSLQVAALTSMATPGMFTPDAVLDHTSMNNGDHATLTVSAPFGTPSGYFGIVYVQVTNSTGDTDLLPVVVGVP